VEPKRGRPFNAALDDEIVAAAAALLAEVGYDAMSMDAVAQRAGVGKATIYRRWPGKAEMVLDTVRSRGLPIDDAEDTGSLRGDLLALFVRLEPLLSEESLGHLSGVFVAMRRDPELGAAVKEQMLEGWARATRTIVERAVARGDVVPPGDDKLELFSRVAPSIVLWRYFMTDGTIDAAFLASLVDDILLPILGKASVL
jgi:AcrR family transcriptional regulator